MKVNARGNTVVLKQHAKETTVGTMGLVMPSKFADEKTIGDVVSVGPDYDHALRGDLNEGDTVVFRNAQRTRIGDEEFLFVNADDVLAVIAE